MADGRARSEGGRDERSPFEPIECRIDCARGDVAPQPFLHLPEDRASVGVLSESKDSEENGLFKGTEDVSHYDYIVDKREKLSRGTDAGVCGSFVVG